MTLYYTAMHPTTLLYTALGVGRVVGRFDRGQRFNGFFKASLRWKVFRKAVNSLHCSMPHSTELTSSKQQLTASD